MTETGQNAAAKWIGRTLVGLGIAGLMTMAGEAIRQSRENGERLAAIQQEIIVRVKRAEEDHSQYVRRDELTEIVKRLDDTLGDLKTELREQRTQRQEQRWRPSWPR